MNLYGVCFKMLGQLGEHVQVVRRIGTPNGNGRVPPDPEVARYHIFAQVTPLDPSPVMREAGYQYTARTIEVNTDFALRGPGQGNLGDQIWWGGGAYARECYLVTNIRMYQKFGVGFVTALCELETQGLPLPREGRSHTLAEEDARQVPVPDAGVS